MMLHILISAALFPYAVGNADTFIPCLPVRSRPQSCDGNAVFRTIAGTCNNLREPLQGAAQIGLERLIPARYVDGITVPYGIPSGRSSGTEKRFKPANEISQSLFQVEDRKRRKSESTVLFMTFGQFVDHDLSLSPHEQCTITDCKRSDAFKYPCIPIQFEVGGQICNPFARATPQCRSNDKQARNQMNTLTAFVDGSQIYGSDDRLASRIRTTNGNLRVTILNRNSFTGLLPFDLEIRSCSVKGGCSLVGDERGDENLPLHAMHTLWVREHNRIATELRRINSNWNGDRVYETTRKIVGGMLQKILYNEWLPSIARLDSYRSYNENVNPSIINAFATAAFRFGHSLVPNEFDQLNSNFDPVNPNKPRITLQEIFNNRENANNDGIERTMFGLLGNRSSVVDRKFAFSIARKLFVPVEDKTQNTDLLAYNIARGRDHGLPGYTAYRKFCKLSVPKSFSALTGIMDSRVAKRFQDLYTSVEDIDLFTGGISEQPIRGLQVGPTFSCLIKEQFRRLRDGDRFFYKNPGVFTTTQLAEIEKARMSRVLCDNLNGIVSIQPSAFLDSSKRKNERVSCERIAKINLEQWKE